MQEFSEFEIRDAATQVPTDYVPAGFSTAALQHTNVKLTWDDDDDRRKKMLRRRVTEGELQDEDLRVSSCPLLSRKPCAALHTLPEVAEYLLEVVAFQAVYAF